MGKHAELTKTLSQLIITYVKVNQIADDFNIYFTIIYANNIIPDIPTSYTHYLNNATESTFNSKLIDNATTMQYLSKIANLHLCGHDNISSSFLRCIAHEICECLINTYHKSINYNRNFFRKYKIAKMALIYLRKMINLKLKTIGLYLPGISKIFKNAMHSQLMKYLTSHKLLSINNMSSVTSYYLILLFYISLNIYMTIYYCIPTLYYVISIILNTN